MITAQETLSALAAYEARPERRALLDALKIKPNRIIQVLLALGALRIGWQAGKLFARYLAPLFGFAPEDLGTDIIFWINAVFTGGFHIFIFLRFYEKTLFRISRRRILGWFKTNIPGLEVPKQTLKVESLSWGEVLEEVGGEAEEATVIAAIKQRRA